MEELQLDGDFHNKDVESNQQESKIEVIQIVDTEIEEEIEALPLLVEGGYVYSPQPENQPTITVITEQSNPIAKMKPKDPTYQPGVFLSGTYAVLLIATVYMLYSVIKGLTKFQALVLGVPKDGSVNGYMTTKRNKTFGWLARCKEDLGWSYYKKGFLLIDIDSGDVPGLELKTAKQVELLLLMYYPLLANVEMLIVPSSSQKYDPADYSWHCYIKCDNMDNNTVVKFERFLQSKAWLSGHGAIKISKDGKILLRQSFDSAVFSPERLSIESVFSNDPDTVFHEIEPLIKEGDFLNIGVEFKSDYNKSDRLIKTAKEAAIPEAYKVKEKYKALKIEELIASGIDSVDAQKQAKAMFDDKIIPSDTIITLNDGTQQYAGLIKVYSEFFHGQYCCDPYYPEDGFSKAVITENGDIYSYKHGGRVYKLKSSTEFILNKFQTDSVPSDETVKKNVVKHLQKVCGESDIDKSDIASIANLLKDKGYITNIKNFTPKKSSNYELSPIGIPLNTNKNLMTLLDKIYMRVAYDEVLKDVTVKHHEINEKIDNVTDTALSIIQSNALREGLPKEIGKDHFTSICMNNYSNNPLVEMVESAMASYDDSDMIKKVTDCWIADCSDELKYEIFKRWIIQGVAAWYHDPSTFKNPEAKLKFENVLTIRSPQGFNKTKMLSELLNFDGLTDYFKAGIILKLKDKDSIKEATSGAIVELGELDATFSSSANSELKAHFSKTFDEIRLPYDRGFSKFKRRTLYAATVNGDKFLSDPTGARRYWVIEIIDIDFKTYDKLDMKILWGQVGKLYHEGYKWWFDPKDPDDAKFLDEINEIHGRHTQVSPMEDLAHYLHNYIEDMKLSNNPKRGYSPYKVLEALGKKNANKSDLNMFISVMRKLGYTYYDSSSQLQLPKVELYSLKNDMSIITNNIPDSNVMLENKRNQLLPNLKIQ